MSRTAQRIGVAIGILVVLALGIALFDWNWLRGPVARAIAMRIDRPVSIAGLHAALLSAHPRVRVSGLKIGNTDWAGGGEMVDIDQIELELRLLPLLRGEVVLPRVDLIRPRIRLFRAADGRANWDFGRPQPQGAERGTPTRLPLVHELRIDSGQLTATDRVRKLTFSGTIVAQTDNGAGFQLKGSGELNAKPFQLRVSGGPLVWAESHKPYPFDMEMVAADIHASARGVVPRPFDLGHLDANLSLSGQDLADGFYLTGLALPNTPPYSISGRLRRTGMKFEFTDVQGSLGGSDIHGNLGVQVTARHPILSADLMSRSLNLADLGPTFGGSAPNAAQEAEAAQATGHPSQAAAQHALTQAVKNNVTAKGEKPGSTSPYLFPTAKLQVDRIRGMDATVHYRAEQVKAETLPLRQVDLHVHLKDSVLRLDPFTLTLPQGKLAGSAVIDVRAALPSEDLDVRLTNVRLDQFHTKGSTMPPLQGTLVGRLKVHGNGDSMHAFASSADGTLSMVVPQGQIEQALVELTGINVVEGLGLMLTKKSQETPVRCGIADFTAHQGIAQVKQVVLDTQVVIITGKGDVNLRDEKLDLQLNGQPKRFRVGVLRTPVEIGGTLRHPSIGVKGGKLVAQGAIAAALATLGTPLAAIAAFVDPGLNKSADCQALLADAKSMGAPLRTAVTKPEGTTRAPPER